MTARTIQVRVKDGWVLAGSICEPDSTIWIEDGDLRIKDRYGVATFPEKYWRYLPLTGDKASGTKE